MNNKIALVLIDVEEPIKRVTYKLNDLHVKYRKVIILSDKNIPELENEQIFIINEVEDIDKIAKFCTLEEGQKENTTAYVLYTSGSTGNPKGVEISYDSFYNFIDGIDKEVKLSENSTILCTTTVSFDIFFLESVIPLIKGMTVILADEQEQNNPQIISNIIINNSIDIIQMTPSRMQMLANYDNRLQCLKNIKKILIGGEKFPINLLRILKKNTEAEIFNLYGPTEATIWATASNLTNKDIIDIGKPLLNVKVYILDNEFKPINNNDVGQICIAGKCLAKGYLNKPELTKEKFIFNKERMYLTGDYGKYTETGDIFYVGRMDNQIKLRGYRIELEEIESVLLGVDGIVNVMVDIYKPHSHDEEGQGILVAFYQENRPINISIIKKHVSSQLPKYMNPILYVKVDEFFYTLNGKLDRNKMKNVYYNQINSKTKDNSKVNSSTESSVINIIKDTLNISTYIDHDTILEEVGVDSIGFMTIIVHLESKFNFVFEEDKLLLSEFRKVSDLIEYVSNNANL